MTTSPKRYYGWIIVYTLAITETISWGIIYYAFSVFITPMEAELGWSRAELTGAFSLGLLMIGILAFPVGSWVDRRGARALMTIGSILATLLVIAWSQVTDLTTFYFIWIALGVCASLVLYDTAFAVVATWFVMKRTTALAIITFAAGLASTIFVPLADFLLNLGGWRDAVLVLGIFLGITTILPHALILRRRPEDLGYLPDGEIRPADMNTPIIRTGLTLKDALRSRFFWMIILAFALSYLSSLAIRVHFIPFLIDEGINASTAALASGAIGFMQVVGRVFFAPLDKRFSSRAMAFGVFAMQAVALAIFLLGITPFTVILFVIVFGMSFGANTLARPSIVADLFGSAHFGRIASVMTIFLTVAGVVAPFMAGVMYDHFGDYHLVLYLSIGLAILSASVMVFSKPDVQVKPA